MRLEHLPLWPPCAADAASVCCGAGALVAGVVAVAGESVRIELESMMEVVRRLQSSSAQSAKSVGDM